MMNERPGRLLEPREALVIQNLVPILAAIFADKKVLVKDLDRCINKLEEMYQAELPIIEVR